MTDPRLTPERIASLARKTADQIKQVETVWCDSSGDEHPADTGPVVFDTTEARVILALIDAHAKLTAENERLRAVAEAAEAYAHGKEMLQPLLDAIDAWKAART